ncbi:hypothetical protein CBR_g40688 [Chara braunii]|uniref:Uncharacterized protein n=1 Tax=Chara braunii TaxID=69332 RepID=A0A388LU77_CHABU|nr:hypothetical protein CBR_g40688 [Chara braunii]|eukprot:GBG85876.1 hypothetical protein CBR_g40688 [Chara braunii]
MASRPVLGIDLGTSFCCAAVYRNKQVEIVPNGIGSRVTPSVVAFNGEKWLAGEAARMFGERHPERCVFEIKRVMGRSFLDPKLVQLRAMWPFEVEAGPTGGVLIRVPGASGEELLEPEEISAILLKEMKRIAENFLDGVLISDAVITVPAYFNDSQREATRKAGVLAGLNVLRLMNEPTAAALAYGYQRLIGKPSAGKNIMVFDLGGGTFDVSIIAVKERDGEECDFEVRAVEGESHLGGADIDNVLTRHVADEYERRTKQSILSHRQVRPRLRQAVVAVKHTLSFEEEAEIAFESEGVEFSMSIDRPRFECLNEHLFGKCIAVVEKALREAGIGKHEISEVVLAGGSTRIPRVQELLTKFFEGRRPLMTVHPDEVVAYGAAVQAGVLAPGLREEDRPAIAVEDITALSIGVKTTLGKMCVIIPKGSPIPAKGSKNFHFNKDDGTTIVFQLHEGERALCRHNRFFGELVQKGFLPLPGTGKAVSRIALEVDSDGIVRATAEATANHKEVGSKVEFQGVLRKDGALAAVTPEDGETDWEEMDKYITAALRSRRELRNLAWEIREHHFSKMTTAEKAKVNEVLNWLSSEVEPGFQSVYEGKVSKLIHLKREVENRPSPSFFHWYAWPWRP